jgi:hypothetical protein
MTLSVFESESDQKYENKYDIDDIRSYPIRFHAYTYVHDMLPAFIYITIISCDQHIVWLIRHDRKYVLFANLL